MSRISGDDHEDEDVHVHANAQANAQAHAQAHGEAHGGRLTLDGRWIALPDVIGARS